jgi:hypothetical protein
MRRLNVRQRVNAAFLVRRVLAREIAALASFFLAVTAAK